MKKYLLLTTLLIISLFALVGCGSAKASESAETAELSLKDISTWITKGNQGKEPYVNFAEEYKSARDYSISNILKTKEDIKSEVVDLIKKGNTLEEASKRANEGKSEKDILFWYNEGRFGNSSHQEFYYQCQEASENNEETTGVYRHR